MHRPDKPMRRGARLVEGVVVVAAYALVAVVLMAPLFCNLGGATLDPHRRWLSGWITSGASEGTAGAMLRDIHLFIWVYAWNWHALLTQPTHWFDANIFYPAPDALAYSEHAIGTLPITGPLQALSGNPVFAYQGNLLLSFALSGAAMYALLRYLGATRPAALFAGLVYSFCPVRRESLFHSYLLAGQYFPLALLFLDRTVSRARWRDAAAFGAFLLLHCLSSYYLAYQALLVLPVCFGVEWWARRPRAPAGLLRATVALTVVGGICAVVSLPYLRVRAGGGVVSFGGLASALIEYSNDLWRSWALPTWLLLWDQGLHLSRGAHAYVGILVFVLAIVGFARGARAGGAAGRLRAIALGIALVSWVLALGPLLPVDDRTITLPYDVLMRWLPGFDSMRVPYRFSLMFMTGVAVLAGLGADVLLRRVGGSTRPWRQAAVAGLLMVLACADYGLGMERYDTRPLLVGKRGPEVYRKLAALPPGPVLELPFTSLSGVFPSERMVHSTTHWMPMLPGSSGYTPPSQTVLTRLAAELPDPRALQLLEQLTGLRYIVLHINALPPAMRPRWLRQSRDLRLKFAAPGARIYELRRRPPPTMIEAVRACARDRTACDALKALPKLVNPSRGGGRAR
jgi:hypothetical protein